MFTSFDKAIMAAIVAGVSLMVGAGWLTDAAAGQFVQVVEPLITALIGFLTVYFWPNKQ